MDNAFENYRLAILSFLLAIVTLLRFIWNLILGGLDVKG